MLPLPPIPTDSLYKFMSVGGLVSCLASTALLFVAAQYIVTERKALVSALDSRSDQLLKLTLQTCDAEFEIAQQAHTWKEEAKAASAAKVAALKERSNAIDKEITERRKGLEKNGEAIVTNLGLCGNLAFGVALFGVAIAICGFALWHLKVQRFQDAILKYEHDKLKRELGNTPSQSP